METTQLAISKAITEALENSMSYEAYKKQVAVQVAGNATSGPKQTEELAYYTKLNAQRMKRIEKTAIIDHRLAATLEKIKEAQHWLLITESWCGDAANAVPILAKIAQAQSHIDFKLVYRDENLELMDLFLTNGGRSIPKLIIYNASYEVLATWGPRPKPLQEKYTQWRNEANPVPYKEFQVTMQQWYNADKGLTIQLELANIFQELYA